MRQHPTRRIVCEGKCNPDLLDYDAVCHRQAQFGDAFQYVKSRARALVHTDHEVVQEMVWDRRMGMVQRLKCTICGHTRLF